MLRFLPALSLSLCLALPLAAQEPPNLPPAPDAPGPVAQLALAWDLWAEGLRREDPLVLLTAIRLARSSDLRQATGLSGPALTDTKADAPAPAGLPRDPASDAALALVMDMAEGDPALADIAANIGADLARDHAGEGLGKDIGKGRISVLSGKVAAGASDVHKLPLNGELPAEIALIGDDSGNLDLAITDDSGKAVCVETGPRDHAYCAFTPLRNGYFTLTVTNQGAGPNLYRLYTN